jgi:hypothetical protein
VPEFECRLTFRRIGSNMNTGVEADTCRIFSLTTLCSTTSGVVCAAQLGWIMGETVVMHIACTESTYLTTMK